MAEFPDDTSQSDGTNVFPHERPRVQLPGANMPTLLYAQHVQDLAEQSAATSIENRLRGMILRNELAQG